jgi:hypothetical protein
MLKVEVGHVTQGKDPEILGFARGGKKVPPSSAKLGDNKGTLCLGTGEYRR